MKRGKLLDADTLKLIDEYRVVFRKNVQRALRQEIAAIRRVLVRSSGQARVNALEFRW